VNYLEFTIIYSLSSSHFKKKLEEIQRKLDIIYSIKFKISLTVLIVSLLIIIA